MRRTRRIRKEHTGSTVRISSDQLRTLMRQKSVDAHDIAFAARCNGKKAISLAYLQECFRNNRMQRSAAEWCAAYLGADSSEVILA